MSQRPLGRTVLKRKTRRGIAGVALAAVLVGWSGTLFGGGDETFAATAKRKTTTTKRTVKKTVRPTTVAARPTTKPQISTTTTIAPARDPLKWPFDTGSIWNMPIGSRATYVPSGLVAAVNSSFIAEDNILLLDPTAPVVPIIEHNGGWNRSVRRCDVRTGKRLFEAPVPAGFFTDPGYVGVTPNHSAALVLADGRTVVQTQPLHRCADGVAVSQYVFPSVDLVSGDGIRGAHGGSGMSAIGGTIRLGEWVPGGNIPHALKLLVDAKRFIAYPQDATPGYRWPAVAADSYAATGYGGSVQQLEMGALIALPPSFDVERLATEPARILARALQRYGAYLVDDSADDVLLIAAEWGPAGRVEDEFAARFGFQMRDRLPSGCSAELPACRWTADVDAIISNLHVVANNEASTPGGPGDRVAPCAPKIRGVSGSVGPDCRLIP